MNATIHDPYPAGQAVTLEPGLRVVLAPNPSPMTHWGTNTYLLGTGTLAVIDPGPEDEAHFGALVQAIGDAPVSHILVTHSHVDHSPLARRLAADTGAPVLGFGGPEAGRSAVMQRLAASGLVGGGEGLDHAFAPDIMLADGDTVAGEGWDLEALWTPGHIGNHLCFDWGGRLFCGDHVMGWASSMVSPPDGDLTQFMISCARLRARGAVRLYPGHGAPVDAPTERIDWLVAHRQARSDQIRAALQDGPATLSGLTQAVYADVDPRLLPAAARNVLAHLVDLHEKSQVRATPDLGADAEFSWIGI
ncbi:MBL fold metallo-hydrolase [Anianabacter salinae]|uniref:MBL fold metallo-hydrolase n=1 Tax=Anianabacter salinae TaxID=2851023 RepID=UPI00225DD799|nr:MBL fold metallo-hydrolase [Anianabacter salinae]